MIRAVLLFSALLSLRGVSLFAAAEDPIVLHAEPVAASPLARIISIQARVEVHVAKDGRVSAACVLEPRPPFVAAISEQAAYKWVFSPTDSSAERTYVLTFIFAPVKNTGAPSHWEVTTVDPLTLRMQYLQSTVRRLADDGVTSPGACPVHRVRMSVDVVPIAYGLPRSYSSDSPSDRDALRRARRVWKARRNLFPEANLWAGGGGCTVQPEETAETYYCENCRTARLDWLHHHPGSEQFE